MIELDEGNHTTADKLVKEEEEGNEETRSKFMLQKTFLPTDTPGNSALPTTIVLQFPCSRRLPPNTINFHVQLESFTTGVVPLVDLWLNDVTGVNLADVRDPRGLEKPPRFRSLPQAAHDGVVSVWVLTEMNELCDFGVEILRVMGFC